MTAINAYTPSPYYRAVDLLDRVKADADVATPDGYALWWAADGLLNLLRNNGALALPVEAVAARVAEAQRTSGCKKEGAPC